MGTDQRKRGYRSENVDYCGYGLGNACVQIREWVQIRAREQTRVLHISA